MRFRIFLLWVVFSSVFAPAAMAGNLDSPGLPSAGSGMYTLQGLYDYLLSGMTPTMSGAFLEPSAGPGSTGKTTKEIYDGISAAFNAADATPDKVLSGSTFFSTDPVNWGPRVGTLATQTPVNTTVSQAAGFYNAFDLSAVDTDLAAGNIKTGTDLFGIIGTVIQASGAATDADVLSGVTYSNASGSSTGAMPNNGAVSITPGTSALSIEAGYHNGSGTVAGDANLATGNIRSGVSIFGVPGSSTVVDTATGTGAGSGDLLSGKTAFVNGATVTGVVPAGSSVTGASGSLSMTIPNGLYSGTETATAVDGNLITGNIKSGVSIFGVSGDPNVVNTSSGDATGIDIVGGKIAWVDGAQITGFGATLSNPAPVEKSGQTTSYATGDDGSHQKGVVLPNPRFTNNGDGTVTDNMTGLIWLQNANCFGSIDWATAISNCNSLASGSCWLSDGSAAGDWRLPNVKELQSLIHFGYSFPALSNAAGTGQWTVGDPFDSVQSSVYWSSTTSAAFTSDAWVVYMYYGGVGDDGKATAYYVWPVRGGQ